VTDVVSVRGEVFGGDYQAEECLEETFSSKAGTDGCALKLKKPEPMGLRVSWALPGHGPRQTANRERER